MKHKFTLQELLISSVIFIALAALCIPVLNGAAKRGSKMSCLDKQKALYQAFSNYTDDHAGAMPDGAILQRRSPNGWWNVLYVYSQNNHFTRCPDAQDPPSGPAIVTYYTGESGKLLKYSKTSIAYNSQLGVGNAGGNKSSSGHGLGYPKTVATLTDLNKPAPLFADIYGQTAMLAGDNRQDQLEGNSPAAGGTFVNRHDGKGNIIFTDGHAEALSGKELWQMAENAYNTSRKNAGTGFPVMNFFLTGQ